MKTDYFANTDSLISAFKNQLTTLYSITIDRDNIVF